MFEKNTTILFQGDSITDGGRGRTEDLYYLWGHGYAYLIAANLGAKCPGHSLRFLNRGCSGDRVVDLYARWKEDFINHSPDVLSILVGVNDVGAAFSRNAGVSSAQFETVYRLMLQDARAALPDIRFVLCEPFVLPVGEREVHWDAWKHEIDLRREVVASLAAEFDAVLVKTQEMFESSCVETGPEYWLWDGVHPTPAGHQLLSQAWLSSVENQFSR
jgi:lysophospholipase L1-like esterase